MDVAAMLIKFKFQIILSVASSLLILSLIYIAPSLIAYFSPLLVSTAIFIVAVVVFGHTTPLSPDSTSEMKTGDGLLDYVASATEEFESYKSPALPEESQPPPQVDDSHKTE